MTIRIEGKNLVRRLAQRTLRVAQQLSIRILVDVLIRYPVST